MCEGEVPLAPAAVEVLGGDAVVPEQAALVAVPEPDSGLVVDDDKVLDETGEARVGGPVSDPHLFAALFVPRRTRPARSAGTA